MLRHWSQLVPNNYVIERAVDFITILEEDFPRQCTNTVFTSSFPPAFQYDIIDRIPERLSFVYMNMSCINYFCQCLFFKSAQSV